jgi:nitrogen fixation NifU-like protein
MDDIYQEQILDHYKNPRNFGDLKSATTVVETNAGCGDTIQMSIQLEDKKIKNIKFKGEGCSLSIAAASMLTEAASGKKAEAIAKLTLRDMEKLMKINIGPGRQKCVTVPLFSLIKAINQAGKNK